MVLQGKARVRRVGNGLCIPIPTREAREDGIEDGDEVDYIIMKPRPRNPKVFGSARKYFKGIDFDEFMAEPV